MERRKCKACGGDFVTQDPKEELCCLCNKALKRLNGYATPVVPCCVCLEHDHDGAVGYCNKWKRWTRMSDFCSRGKRGE